MDDRPKPRKRPKPPQSRGQNRGRPHRAERAEPGDDAIVLYGIHPVAAALDNPARRIVRMAATENAERKLAEAIGRRAIAVERVLPRDLDRRLGEDTVHQGIAAEVEPLPDVTLADLVARARQTAGPIVVLDQVTDPHNVGAILRSAAVFGAAGMVMTGRHSPPLNGTLAKSASGALELVPIALVQNLARALAELRQAGVHVVGLDGAAPTLLEDAELAGPLALVLGAEGKGLRQLTRETCDAIHRIGTGDALASLNVSNAAAITLHLAAMRRRAVSSG